MTLGHRKARLARDKTYLPEVPFWKMPGVYEPWRLPNLAWGPLVELSRRVGNGQIWLTAIPGRRRKLTADCLWGIMARTAYGYLLPLGRR